MSRAGGLACLVWTFGLLSSGMAYRLSGKTSSGLPDSFIPVAAALKAALRSSALFRIRMPFNLLSPVQYVCLHLSVRVRNASSKQQQASERRSTVDGSAGDHFAQLETRKLRLTIAMQYQGVLLPSSSATFTQAKSNLLATPTHFLRVSSASLANAAPATSAGTNPIIAAADLLTCGRQEIIPGDALTLYY